MQPPPQLKPEEVRVLRVIMGGMIDGRRLMRKAGIKSPAQLREAVERLLKYDLVSASGLYYDDSRIRSAVFSIPPSSASYAEYTLKSQPSA